MNLYLKRLICFFIDHKVTKYPDGYIECERCGKEFCS